MMLLYSDTLYAIYRNSAGWSLFFYFALTVVTIIHWNSFKDNYTLLRVLFIGYFLFELSYFLTSSYFQFRNNLFLAHPYVIFSASFLGIIYHSFVQSVWLRTFLKVTVPIFVVLSVFFFFYDKGYLESPKLPLLYNLIFLVVYLYVQRALLLNAKIKNLKSEPLFWINTGLLLYIGFSLLFSIFHPMLLKISNDLAFISGTINNLLEPIYLVLLTIGIYKLKKKKKPMNSL